jgi:hypothetical protein
MPALSDWLAVACVVQAEPEPLRALDAQPFGELLREQRVVLVLLQALVDLVEVRGGELRRVLSGQLREGVGLLDGLLRMVAVFVDSAGEAVLALVHECHEHPVRAAVALRGVVQDLLHLVAQGVLVRDAVVGDCDACCGAVGVDGHGDDEAVARREHGEVLLSTALDALVQLPLVALQFVPGVPQDVVDRHRLLRGAVEFARCLADELLGHGGVHAVPVGFDRLVVQAFASLFLQGCQATYQQAPVIDRIIEQLEVGVIEVVEIHWSTPLASFSIVCSSLVSFLPGFPTRSSNPWSKTSMLLIARPM